MTIQHINIYICIIKNDYKAYSYIYICIMKNDYSAYSYLYLCYEMNAFNPENGDDWEQR